MVGKFADPRFGRVLKSLLLGVYFGKKFTFSRVVLLKRSFKQHLAWDWEWF